MKLNIVIFTMNITNRGLITIRKSSMSIVSIFQQVHIVIIDVWEGEGQCAPWAWKKDNLTVYAKFVETRAKFVEIRAKCVKILVKCLEIRAKILCSRPSIKMVPYLYDCSQCWNNGDIRLGWDEGTGITHSSC